MQRLGELNNKVIIEQVYEPENKNVIWKDPINNVFKEYTNGTWVKSGNLDTPFPYNYVKLPDITVTFDEPVSTLNDVKLGHIDLTSLMPQIEKIKKGIGINNFGQIKTCDGYASYRPDVSFDNTFSISGVTLTFKIYVKNSDDLKIGDFTGTKGGIPEILPAGTYSLSNIILFCVDFVKMF